MWATLVAGALLLGGPAGSAAASDPSSFAPTVAVVPSNSAPDAPTGLGIDVDLPQANDPGGLAPPALKQMVITLPDGMSLAPAAADGLETCSDAQLNPVSSEPVACPDAASVGTVSVTIPSLSEVVSGRIDVRPPNADDPETGGTLRIALVLEDVARDVALRLPGQIRADPTTGRLEVRLDELPDRPLSRLQLTFAGGPHALFASPADCGPKTVGTRLTSWGGEAVDRVTTFEVDCLPGLGDFGPSFVAGVSDPTAGASTPLALEIGKPDGQPALSGVRLAWPEGLLPTFKGRLETRVGTAAIAAGPGPEPLWRSGPVVLEGPYGDAPYSLRTTVPMRAGPLGLGDLVVRQRLYVDPHDAHVTVVSDPLPTTVSGVPVRVQHLSVVFDEPGFLRNPTSCGAKTIAGELGSVAGQTAAVSAPLAFSGCDALPLAPRIEMAMPDRRATRQGQTTPLVASLTQAPGQAGLSRVSVTLPPSFALMADNAHALCTPEQGAAHACPAGSIIGRASATTPLLDEPLTGDVYFVEGLRRTATGRMAKTLPKMWIALRGPIALDVWTETDLHDDRLVHRFAFLPDLPITAFRLEVFGGPHGVLAVSAKDHRANVCAGDQVADAVIDGQNGKRLIMRPRISTPCGFAVVAKTLSPTRIKLRLGGLGAGRLSVSGRGVRTTSRRITFATAATLHAKLTRAGRARYRRHAPIALRASFRPAATGAGSKRTRATVRHAPPKRPARKAKRHART